MTTYRWNISDYAVGYDQSAEFIHPYYFEMQQFVLGEIPFAADAEFLLADLGGGSGRLVEKFLDAFPRAHGVVVDQSAAFLGIAERRLARFGARAHCLLSRLQEDWTSLLPSAPSAVVSMSAIHHLEPGEKQDLFRRIHAALLAGGVFINGDEVRPADDDDYLQRMQTWDAHMRAMIEAGKVPPAIAPALAAWAERNIGEFTTAKKSGDDCHDTVEEQIAWLSAAGFAHVTAPWQKEMWAVMSAR